MDNAISLNIRRVNGNPVTAESQTFNVGNMLLAITQKENASATRVTVTATMTYPNHGLVSGDSIVVNGVAPFTGTFTVTVLNANQFTYTVLNSGATSSTALTVDRTILNYDEYTGPGSSPAQLTITGTRAALVALIPIGYSFVATIVNNGTEAENSAIANGTPAVIFTKFIVNARQVLGSTLTLTDIDRSGTTATVTSAAHGLATGQYITVDATNNALDGTYAVTVTNANVFTYTTESSGTISNATGTATTNNALLELYTAGAFNRNYTLNESYPYVVFQLAQSNDSDYSLETGITAFATGGQTNATRLTASYNNVTTVATAGDSVLLEDLAIGQSQIIKNNGAANLAVFPPGSRTIDGGAASASITMAPGTTRQFVSISATNFQSNEAIVTNGTVFTLTTGITAFATGGQASAVALTTYFNNITTCATAGDSVKLLTAAAGTVQVVTNNGATAADVFPFSGDTINGGAANAAIRLGVGETIVFTAIDATDWRASFAGAGTVGNPSLPVGTKNKGFYQVSTNQLGTSINGTLVQTFDTLGMTADSLRNRVNLGTTPVGTVAIVEYGDGKDITTVLTLTNFIVGALAGAAAALGVGNIVYAYPAGQHLELVDSFSALVLTAAGTSLNTDTGLGSVIASGAVATLDGTATFENRLTGQTIGAASGGGTAASALLATTAGIGTGIALNVAASIKNVFLNSAATWNADNTGNLLANGVIVLKWTRMQ